MRPANPIRIRERDYFLELDEAIWPPSRLEMPAEEEDRDVVGDRAAKEGTDWQAGRWHREPDDATIWGCLLRGLSKTTSKGNQELQEAVVRFPSAPLSGIQQKPDFQFRLEQRHNHTFRILARALPATEPMERLFIFLNGMNEIDHFGFYYDLAALLSSGNPRTACLVYPYPGHLSRYPMLGRYAEKPLQRFIMDPADLFRQYLRFMIEMQWLLSVIVPVSYYPVAPGLPLLAEDEEPTEGRCNSATISAAIHEEWRRIQEYSGDVIEVSDQAEDLKKLRSEGSDVTAAQVRHSVETIRRLIRWKAFDKNLAELRFEDSMPRPAIHIIGYSLGAYLAQSAFFTWPFALGSCTSVCAGAPLPELRPVIIAHEEEWRSITHGLRYEIDSGILEQRIRLENDEPDEEHGQRSICGIRASYFVSHFRIFTDVFLQDAHGSYRPRVSEFAPRLLFVVGGNDPIVSTKSVLDASPIEGINMIEIANLTHFIALPNDEWWSFWLPTAAGVISSLAEHSESHLARSVLSNLWDSKTMGPAKEWGPPHQLERPALRRGVEALDSVLMRRLLAEMVDPLTEQDEPGFLLILRNQVPFTLMGKRLLHRRGSTPHYEDFEIRWFWNELQERMATLKACIERITVVVPGRLNEWIDRQPSILSAKSVPLARELPGRESQKEIWRSFLDEWWPSLYRFDPHHPTTIPNRDGVSDIYDLERTVREVTSTPPRHPVVNCLPDVWMSLSHDVVTTIGGGISRGDIHRNLLRWTYELYLQMSLHRKERTVESKNFGDWLRGGKLIVVRVSAAQANPRFLGERFWEPRNAVDLVVHSALALARSTDCTAAPGMFNAGWPPADR